MYIQVTRTPPPPISRYWGGGGGGYWLPAINVDMVNTSGLLSARQRNAIQMAFRWWADSGPNLHVGCG